MPNVVLIRRCNDALGLVSSVCVVSSSGREGSLQRFTFILPLHPFRVLLLLILRLLSLCHGGQRRARGSCRERALGCAAAFQLLAGKGSRTVQLACLLRSDSHSSSLSGSETSAGLEGRPEPGALPAHAVPPRWVRRERALRSLGLGAHASCLRCARGSVLTVGLIATFQHRWQFPRTDLVHHVLQGPGCKGLQVEPFKVQILGAPVRDVVFYVRCRHRSYILCSTSCSEGLSK
mmetsp:Transcript_133755/g.333804  ORF Transcript_133755/g.333804 Transcript_133755/m.333804 type:complete len:234 (+) Transcript_133755:1233-1934(+)